MQVRERKNFADDVDGFAQAVGGAEGAEVVAAVFDDFAGDGDARPCVIGDLGAQVGFVVLETDVVAGLVLLDQVVLEDQRFFLAAGDDGVEVTHPLHQEAHLEAAVAALAEVGAHARPQRLGLADVEHFAGAIAQQVDAGFGRSGAELLIERRRFVFEDYRLGRNAARRGCVRGIFDERAVQRACRLFVLVFGAHRGYYYIIAPWHYPTRLNHCY